MITRCDCRTDRTAPIITLHVNGGLYQETAPQLYQGICLEWFEDTENIFNPNQSNFIHYVNAFITSVAPPGLTGDTTALSYGSIKTTLWKQKNTKGTKCTRPTNEQ